MARTIYIWFGNVLQIDDIILLVSLQKNGQYEFQYCEDIEKALEVGFTPLVSFERLNVVYKSEILFPVFASRLPDRKRKDIKNF